MGPRFNDRGEAKGEPAPIPQDTLQWGRGSMTAERSGEAIFKATMDAASMGPRFNDRGERPLIGVPRSSGWLLQWGRGSMTAERRVGHGHFRGSDAASMGPRFNDRGELAIPR